MLKKKIVKTFTWLGDENEIAEEEHNETITLFGIIINSYHHKFIHKNYSITGHKKIGFLKDDKL